MDDIIHHHWRGIVNALNDTNKEYKDNIREAILNQTGINIDEFMTGYSGVKLKEHKDFY